MKPILSICIPSYNRPQQLLELLTSIDCDPENIEIVVCEDHSPQRQKIRENVASFMNKSSYEIRYIENESNLGFDGNIRELVELAKGCFVMFMGDDDLFIPRALERFLEFIKEHADKKYILRSYVSIHSDGWVENFHYLPMTTVLPRGEKTVSWLFKRSVTICGFTINRDVAQKVATGDLDGTLLYQVYLMSKICLEYDSIYCGFPVAQAGQSFRDDNPNFGASIAEQSRYKPGKISEDNSINFTKAYFEVTKYIDVQHGTQLTNHVLVDLSKNSYPFLSIQRKRGIRLFLKYANRLERECGFGCTFYYFVYKWGLVLLGERICDRLIGIIKKVIGHTPSF